MRLTIAELAQHQKRHAGDRSDDRQQSDEVLLLIDLLPTGLGEQPLEVRVLRKAVRRQRYLS
jgi:hypothetical protein